MTPLQPSTNARTQNARPPRPDRRALTGFALAWLLVLAVIPVALWHRVLSDTLGSFHWSLGYAVGELGPWCFLVAGLAFLAPVAVSAGRQPESRLYPRARKAYFAWGTVLYLLGMILALQVAEVWHFAH